MRNGDGREDEINGIDGSAEIGSLENLRNLRNSKVSPNKFLEKIK